MARLKFTSKNGKRVTVDNYGEIFVNGKATGLRQWASSSTRYSSIKSGSEQKDIKGLGVEEALWKRGLLGVLSQGIKNLGFFFVKN